MLRDYQQTLTDDLRVSLRDHRTVFAQLPTGGGKTAIFSAITEAAFGRSARIWIIVPRNELMDQASEHLKRHRIPHGHISATSAESRAFNVHIVSKDTLIRRWDRIKNWPDLIIIDEAHINYEFQKDLCGLAPKNLPGGLPFEGRLGRAPASTRILGFSATPERLDGKGLSEIYGAIVYGPSIPWLTARGFLSPLRYYAPPLVGVEEMKWIRGEADPDSLEALLESRKVYDDVIRLYREHGKGKAALIFTHTVKEAYRVAQQFRDAGFKFECIEGNMTMAKRRELIEGLRTGKLDGLTNRDLCTYGLDVPRVEFCASLRLTRSRSLYFQKIGRALRPYVLCQCPVCGSTSNHEGLSHCHGVEQNVLYKKKDAVFFDLVGLLNIHQDADNPGVPLFYLDKIEWNFDGFLKRAKPKAELAPICCPFKDYQWCSDPACRSGCKADPNRQEGDGQKELKTVAVELVERTPGAQWAALEPGERREVQDRIGRNVEAFEEAMKTGGDIGGPIADLLKVAEELERAVMWVYWTLAADKKAVQVPILHEIARVKNYAPGWAWRKMREIRVELQARAKEEGVLL